MPKPKGEQDVDLPGDEPSQGSGRAGGRSSNEQGVELPGDEDPRSSGGRGG